MGKTKAIVTVRHKDVVRCINQALCYYQIFANGFAGEAFSNSMRARIDGDDVQLLFQGLEGDSDEVMKVIFRIWNPEGGTVVLKLDKKTDKYVAKNYVIM